MASKGRAFVTTKVKKLIKEGYPQKQAVAIALSEARKSGLIKGRSNPGVIEVEDSVEESEELARGFHGRGNKETYVEKYSEVYRENLAILGDMEELEVFNRAYWAEHGDFIKVSFKAGQRATVKLCGSSDRTQLYLVGGDQEIPQGFIDEVCEVPDKDKIQIGWIYSISYRADKHHLGGSSGKVEPYMHCFGEVKFPNPNARNDGMADYQIWKLGEKVKCGALPMLVYDRLNQHQEVVGGIY